MKRYLSPDELMDELTNKFEELGIGNFLFIANHPDNDMILKNFNGDMLWGIGAVEVMRDELKDTFRFDNEDNKDKQ